MKTFGPISIGFCLVVLSAMPARAEDPVVGVDVGVNASYLAVTAPGQSSSIKAGALVGGFAILPITRTISIQPEVQYSQRHSQLTNTSGTTSQTADLSLDYVTIPVLVRMKLFSSLYVVEGPSFNFPVRATSQISGGPSVDIKNNIVSPDVSIVVGVGVPIHKKITLEGRWDSGVRSLEKTLAPNDEAKRNRAISAVLAVPF